MKIVDKENCRLTTRLKMMRMRMAMMTQFIFHFHPVFRMTFFW